MTTYASILSFIASEFASMADGGFGKQDFRYLAEEDKYFCPIGERRDDEHHAA